MSLQKQNLIGKRFGKLVVTSEAPRGKDQRWWHCTCDCGGTTIQSTKKLNRKHSKSCGCLQGREFRSIRMTKHGLTFSKEYAAYHEIKKRCYNQNANNYKNYGGRGIIMCDKWLNSFEVFLSDVGKAPSKLYSIDRINNNKNYEPGNCRWATRREQVLNRRNSRVLTIDNETKPFADWCIQLGKNYHNAYDAIYRRGESPKQVLMPGTNI